MTVRGDRDVHIWKTFLAGMFLGAAALGAIMPWFGLTAPVFPTTSFVSAVSAGDFLETAGAIAVGLVAALLVSRQQSSQAAAQALEAQAASEHAHAFQLEVRAADVRAHDVIDA